MNTLKKLTIRLTSIFGSNKAWWLIFGLFVFQAFWLALSMAYPAVFDEGVHFETIKLYATQWSPFFDSQAVGNDYLGQIIGQTSFLFYWLLSFVYRLLEFLGVNEVGIILSLRFINIALFGAGLVVGRKLLRTVKLSPAATNLALFVLVMIPIVPQLAGQINYDNPLFLLVNLSLLFAVKIIHSLRDERKLDIRLLAYWGLISVTASIVKVAFLPIFAASGLVLLGWVWWYVRQTDAPLASIRPQLQLGGAKDYILLGLLVAIGGLFVLRYGGNLINYGELQPGCDVVLNEQRCRAFGPYGRDYLLNQQLSSDFEPDPIQYARDWYRGMHNRLLFTINGNTPLDTYQNFPPLPVVSATVHAISAVGLAAVLLTLPRRLKNPTDVLFMSVVALYVGVLFVRNYTGSYLSTGQMVAINGRYLLVVLLPAMAVVLRAASELLGRRQQLKAILATVIIIGVLQGGGISGYVIRSSSNWWWGLPEVATVNRTAGELVSPLIIGD